MRKGSLKLARSCFLPSILSRSCRFQLFSLFRSPIHGGNDGRKPVNTHIGRAYTCLQMSSFLDVGMKRVHMHSMHVCVYVLVVCVCVCGQTMNSTAYSLCVFLVCSIVSLCVRYQYRDTQKYHGKGTKHEAEKQF